MYFNVTLGLIFQNRVTYNVSITGALGNIIGEIFGKFRKAFWENF